MVERFPMRQRALNSNLGRLGYSSDSLLVQPSKEVEDLHAEINGLSLVYVIGLEV